MERVYLAMCSLKRPFDDQRQPRVRAEASAIAVIVARAEARELALVRSPAHLVENDANPRDDRRVAAACPWSARFTLDALHLAFAERAGARWFVTRDDALVRLAGRVQDALRTLVVLPPALASRSEG